MLLDELDKKGQEQPIANINKVIFYMNIGFLVAFVILVMILLFQLRDVTESYSWILLPIVPTVGFFSLVLEFYKHKKANAHFSTYDQLLLLVPIINLLIVAAFFWWIMP